jgi:hypothetical protein
MDKRTLLALVLMALVIVVTPMMFPSSRRATPAPTDSLAAPPTTAAPNTAAVVPAPSQPTRPTMSRPSAPPANVVAESTVLAAPRAKYSIVSPGAVPSTVQINGYSDLRPGRRDS